MGSWKCVDQALRRYVEEPLRATESGAEIPDARSVRNGSRRIRGRATRSPVEVAGDDMGVYRSADE